MIWQLEIVTATYVGGNKANFLLRIVIKGFQFFLSGFIMDVFLVFRNLDVIIDFHYLLIRKPFFFSGLAIGNKYYW
jgi:hypothetical protein